MLKKSWVLLSVGAAALIPGMAFSQIGGSAKAEIGAIINEYKRAGLSGNRRALADWVANNVASAFMGVSTPDMSTMNKKNWYQDALTNSQQYRATKIEFKFNSIDTKKGVAVIRMNLEFVGSRMQNRRKERFRSFGSYRDTWRWMNGRWMLDTDEERSYKMWVNGKLTVSRLQPEK